MFIPFILLQWAEVGPWSIPICLILESPHELQLLCSPLVLWAGPECFKKEYGRSDAMSLLTICHQIWCSFPVVTWNDSSQHVSFSKHRCQAERIHNHTERPHVHTLISSTWACSVHQHSPETSKWLKEAPEDFGLQNSKAYEHIGWPSAPNPITAEWQFFIVVILHTWRKNILICVLCHPWDLRLFVMKQFLNAWSFYFLMPFLQ